MATYGALCLLTLLAVLSSSFGNVIRAGLNTGRRNNALNSSANTTTECQLRSRRKAAKMLVAVVVMFAVCYFPVHLLSILSIVVELPQNQMMVIFSMLSHWLCYANSAINPVIYNFMSAKYRREFSHAFSCGPTLTSNQRSRNAHASYACRYTTTSAPSGGSTSCKAVTEIVPVSNSTSSTSHDD